MSVANLEVYIILIDWCSYPSAGGGVEGIEGIRLGPECTHNAWDYPFQFLVMEVTGDWKVCVDLQVWRVCHVKSVVVERLTVEIWA